MDKEDFNDWLWVIAGCIGVVALWYIAWKITQHILGG